MRKFGLIVSKNKFKNGGLEIRSIISFGEKLYERSQQAPILIPTTSEQG
jgi:hypothetical protein